MPTVDGAALKITFDEALDTSSVPAAPGGFTVTVTRGGSAVSGHTVSTLSLSSDGTVLTLTLALAVRGGDEVKLAYEPPGTNPLQDRADDAQPGSRLHQRGCEGRGEQHALGEGPPPSSRAGRRPTRSGK